MQRHNPKKQIECRLQRRTSAASDTTSLIKHQPPITRKNRRLLKQRSTTDLKQPDLTIYGKTLWRIERVRAQSIQEDRCSESHVSVPAYTRRAVHQLRVWSVTGDNRNDMDKTHLEQTQQKCEREHPQWIPLSLTSIDPYLKTVYTVLVRLNGLREYTRAVATPSMLGI
jgi:hypothetical protein